MGDIKAKAVKNEAKTRGCSEQLRIFEDYKKFIQEVWELNKGGQKGATDSRKDGDDSGAGGNDDSIDIRPIEINVDDGHDGTFLTRAQEDGAGPRQFRGSGMLSLGRFGVSNKK